MPEQKSSSVPSGISTEVFESAVRGISTILSELNHAVRTPLGVALNVCSDASRGIEVTRNDHQDAVDALNRLRSKFDQLRPFLIRDYGSVTEFTDVDLLLEEEGFELHGQAGDIQANPLLLRSCLKYLSAELSKRSLPLKCELRGDAAGLHLGFPGYMPDRMTEVLLETWLSAAGGHGEFSSERIEFIFRK